MYISTSPEYTSGPKSKLLHVSFYHNWTKYRPIFILLLEYSTVNSKEFWRQVNIWWR